MKRFFIIISIIILMACTKKEAVEATRYKSSKLQEVYFNEVHIQDSFWEPKISIIQNSTLPMLFDLAEEQGKIDNFRVVAGIKKDAKINLYNAPDSDVYKLIEAAAYTFSQLKNEELQTRVDEIIELILAAQDENGYLHTQYMLDISNPCSPDTTIKSNANKIRTFGYGSENRWKSLKHNWPFAYSQLYCAGHMMEAAVAYYRGTGKEAFLKGAIKFADHICDVFDEEKIKTYADHPEVEIGLMKIYEVSGDEKYLKIADLFSRYVDFSRPVDIDREANSQALQNQCDAYGHCVRTAYIYSGATDVVRALGADDLKNAINKLWQSVVGKKMYIHGGTGNGTHAEQHGHDYDLPIKPTYSECCANIAQGQWNHRLNLLTAESKYADVVELEAYNSALSGIRLDGERYSYSNKINIGTKGRKNKQSGVREHYLFCCPSKLPGFVAGIGRWVYAKNESGLFVNLFVSSEVSTQISGQTFTMKQETNYPWNGNVKFAVTKSTGSSHNISIRIPSWLNGEQLVSDGLYHFKPDTKSTYKLLLNGNKIDPIISEQGYVILQKKWKNGDVIELDMNMQSRRVYTDEKVNANRGRVALMYGPLLYCLEGIDNDFNVLEMVLPENSKVVPEMDSNLFNGVMTLKGKAVCNEQKVEFKAVPYFTWENRGIYKMSLLLIEDPNKVNKQQETEQKEFNTQG